GRPTPNWERNLRRPDRRSSFPRLATMSATRAVAVAVLLVGACRDASTPLQPVPRSGAEIPGQYIVVFRDNVPEQVALTQSLLKAQGDRRLHTYTSEIGRASCRERV